MFYSSFELALILCLAIIAILWWHSIHIRGIAVDTAQKWCNRNGWQLLDETVALEKLRMVRQDNGTLGLIRTYCFEYSDTGNNRMTAFIMMAGDQILYLGHKHPSSKTIKNGPTDINRREDE